MSRTLRTLPKLPLCAALTACGGPSPQVAPADAKAACRAALNAAPTCELIGQSITPERHMSLAGALTELPPAGRAALIDFWSVDCAPCVAAMPELQAAAASGVSVVGVAVDDNPGRVMNTAKARGVSYPLFLDAAGRMRGAFRVGADLPRLFVLDATGTVRGVFGGAAGSVDQAVALVHALER